MYDLIIIGGGPAALSAAFYAMGKELDRVMLCEDLGGKVGWLESLAGPDQTHYLPGNELVHLLTKRLMSQSDRIIHDRALTVASHDATFVVETREHGVLEGSAVIVATGAMPLKLDVAGVRRLVDRGLGYSITTYAHLAGGKRVAVIGATLRSLSGAAELARTVKQLYVIAPDPALVAATRLGAALRQLANVEVLEGYEVTAVIGGDTVEELLVARNGQTRRISVDRAFVDFGLVPNSAIVQDLVDRDAEGFILVNDYHETTTPGVFAAGDVTTTPGEQVLTAIGDGTRAAMSAYDYLLARWLMPGSLSSR